MIAQIVRFKSRLSDEQVLEMYRARAPRYRSLRGLVEKYYLRFSETDEHGAVYLWDSEEDLRNFRASELARTIPDAYQVEGPPSVLTAALVMTLRGPHAPAIEETVNLEAPNKTADRDSPSAV